MDPTDGCLKFEIMKDRATIVPFKKNCALFQDNLTHVP